MFTLAGSGIRNILFNVKLRNPTQLPAQLTFCPAQFASKKAHNFNFFPAPCQKACTGNTPMAVKNSVDTAIHSFPVPTHLILICW